MLLGLGKWLRAAGYDTLFVKNDMKDKDVFNFSSFRKEAFTYSGQTLSEDKRAQRAYPCSQSNSLPECISELTTKLNLNWLYLPFSRCLLCNSILLSTNDPFLREQVADRVQGPLWFCEHCHKVYWQGSHTKRMLQMLAAFCK